MKNAHLPFDRLMALSNVEGLRCLHPSSLRRTGLYVSLLGPPEADKDCRAPCVWTFLINLQDRLLSDLQKATCN
jgi:hypothetical protein